MKLEAADEEGLKVVGDEAIAHRQPVLKVLTTIYNRHMLQEVLDLLRQLDRSLLHVTYHKEGVIHLVKAQLLPHIQRVILHIRHAGAVEVVDKQHPPCSKA